MPSIRVKSSGYINIRDIFPEARQPGAASVPASTLSPLSENPAQPTRPFSLPLQPRAEGVQEQESIDVPLSAPVHLAPTTDSTWTSRRRSNSRVQAHLLGTHSARPRSQWSTSATIHSSSTDPLYAQSPTISAASPTLATQGTPHSQNLTLLQGRDADIEYASETRSPGILERNFSMDSKEPRSSRPPLADGLVEQEDDHHHDDIVEHLDVIGV